MFIERLLNQGNAPLIEQTLQFSAERQRLLNENGANIDTIGYLQKDLSPEKFQAMLRERVEQRKTAGPGATNFDDISTEIENPDRNLLFHDGNNRSMEQLMSAGAKNALMHNLMIELLKKQFSSIKMALQERPG